MAKTIVLISGSVCSGKSTLCQGLSERFSFTLLKTRECLEALRPGDAGDRTALQRAGDELDRTTGGNWVCDSLLSLATNLPPDALIAVDAVRVREQIDSIRRAFGARVVHIHLLAPEPVLAKRYKRRKRGSVEPADYSGVRENRTELLVGDLANIADVVIDSNRCVALDVLVRAASYLGLYQCAHSGLVDVIVGGQFGSEGKGHISSYLAKEYGLLVRVGGPNAGHKIFGQPPYTFHQLPSGTGRSSAKLLLGPGAVVSVGRLLQEIADWEVSKDRLAIDPNVFIIESGDCHQEEALVSSIGSTGQGVGAATSRRIMARGSSVRLAKDIRDLRPFIRESLQVLEEVFYRGERVLLEGTQGTGLSLYHGHYPHVTSRDTTIAGCLAEAGIAPSHVRKTIMVCRTYPIRVESPHVRGRTSGPLSQPINWNIVAQRSGLDPKELRAKERTSTTNRKRRVGEFDWSLLRRASFLNGPTDIALTFSDYINKKNREARRFGQLTEETIHFIEEVERVSGAPVSLISTRFDFRSIIDRRAW